MDGLFPKEDSTFYYWILNFSKVLFEFKEALNIGDSELNQINNLISQVTRDIKKNEMGIEQEMLVKYHQKERLKIMVINVLNDNINHSEFSQEIREKLNVHQ
ncbi:MAG: hypothetical protein ACK4ND_05840 [Cytophagaceae bacterium]